MNLYLAHDCPGEQVLLDYLVGELGSATARDVERHLETCTDCALRADQLSEDFGDVERAIDVELPLPPLRLAAARRRLQERQEAYETSRAARGGSVRLGGTWARLALAAAAAVVLVGVATTLLSTRDEPALTAGQVLDRAQESVPTYGLQPSMARYEVEFVQLRPVDAARKHELVIWTDPGSGGYSSRLEDPDGALRHAVWRTASNGPTFAYDQAVGEALVRIDRSGQDPQPTLLASMGNGIDCDVLAAGFARWLEDRHWEPLRVSRDFTLLASDDATLRLERSAGVLLVVAHKQEGDLRAEITLTLGAESFEPHSIQIHFQSPNGESTFKLVQNEVRFIAASHLDASVFEARVPPSTGLRAKSMPATRPQPGPASAGPDRRTVEAKLRHALHEARACLGEPVEVVRAANGALAVRGIVGTGEMKAAILTALDRSDVPDAVTVDIRTQAESIGSADRGFEFAGPSVRPAINAGSPSARSGPVSGLPLTSDLTAYFRAADPLRAADSVGKDLSAFAAGAVDRADDLLRRAWALRRLAERYGPSTAERISPEAAALVREMCRDHLHGVAHAARRSADWTLPALDAIAISRGVEEGAPQPISQSSASTRSWSGPFLSLFEAANSIHSDTLVLLTVRLDVTASAASERGRARSLGTQDVDHALRRLLARLREFGPEVTRTVNAFAASSDPVPAVPLGREAER